jgi:P4 family phage/plasmid primase-like protien
MTPDTPAKSPRTYSAKTRAAADGKENREAERIEKELRERLAKEEGEPVIYNYGRNGEPAGIKKVTAPFFARLFSEKHDVLFEQEEDRLYSYNDERGLWQVKAWEENLVQLSRFMLTEGRREGFEEILGKRGLNLDKEIQAYLKGLVGKRGVFRKEPDAVERFIHFRNGVFVIRNGKLEGFRPGFRKEDLSRNQIPIDFKEGEDCPRVIEELLLPVLPPETAEEDIALLFRFLGLFLLGVNLPQRMLILDGAAGAGKSTFAKLAGLLVGRENVAQLRTRQLAERFELFAFIGKTLLLGADVSPKFLLTPGAEVLKTLVGGDFLEAEAKLGNDRVSFLGSFNVLINTNSQLRVKIEEDVDAWRRRLAVITFLPHVPAIRIPSFERVLFEQEGSGIVNRALQGLRELLDAGGSLSMTPAQFQRVEDLLERSEPLGEFLRDRVVKREGASIAKKRLRERFKDYCRERRWSLPTDREIGSKLPELMREIFTVAECNNVTDPDCQVDHVAGYRGVDWSND